ncbi:MAG: ABC transporter ATP-binding protein [Deltaproteobacteria bacterium]|nr:ABC transporter ATP-binding protein [Deltaproteobacteria bacterium]MBW2393376.1 ABC transporter ATP-binding protein [Deltaproteobacteria bacterium]
MAHPPQNAVPPRSLEPGSKGLGPLGHLGQGGAQDRLPFRLVLRLLGRCLQWLRPLRRHLIALFAGFGLVAVMLFPIGLLLLDLIWTRVLQGEPLPLEQAQLLGLDPTIVTHVELLAPTVRRDLLESALLVVLAATAIVTPLVLGLYYYQVWILQRVNQLLRVRLLDQLQRLSMRFHSDHSIGDAIYRMMQDSAMVTQLVELLFLTPISTLGRYIFGILIVATFDPMMALLLGLLWPPLLVLGYWFSQRLRVGFREARETNAALTSRIQETLVGIKVIKAYGAERRWQDVFEDASHTAFDAAYRSRSRLAVFTVSLFWVCGIWLIASGAFAAIRSAESAPLMLEALGFSIWTLGLYNFFKLRFSDGAGQLRLLFKTWGRTQDVAIGLDRIFELLDLEPEVQDEPDAVPLESIGKGIVYRNVRFRYQADRPALEGVDFEASVGTMTAIVGPTGSGKTTLMALLLRLFDPDSGTIEIGGQDLRHFQTASVRDAVAVALQENLLFGTTVRENIRYAMPDASDAAVREAARVAGADEFIAKLPNGYDTMLGERGTKLSTGQRQRLSIARAILKDTPILILDEPTASLDAETEIRVLRNLAEWGRGRLIFLITHRLSSIRRADTILVLRDGQIVERGTHEELTDRAEGVYSSLFRHESQPGHAVGARP